MYQRTATNGHFGNEEFPWEKPKALVIRDHIRAKIVERQKLLDQGKILHCESSASLAH